MDDKEVFNPQSGERIAPKKSKKFWKDWRFYVYTIIAVMLAIVSVSSMVTACAAINAGVGSEVNSSLSVEYVRRNARTTTDEGGYTKYQFSVSPSYPSEAEKATIKWYTWDEVNAETELSGSVTLSVAGGITGVKNSVNTALTSPSNSPTGDEIKLVTISGYSTIWDLTRYWFYMTWYRTSVTGTWAANAYAFVPSNLINNSSTLIVSLNNNVGAYTNMSELPVYFQGNEVTNFVWLTGHAGSAPQDLYVFQDVVSYYKEQGYHNGHTSGYSEGHTAGYSEGHTAGYAEGYEAGETHAYETLQTGIAFETYGMYANATLSLVADRTEGSYYYMDLFDYVTDTNIERSVYVIYTQNASNSTWLGYVQDVNASDSSGATYDIGSFSGASSTTDVVFTALMDRNLWEGAYITSFHGHAEAVNDAFWFTGGSYAATQQIYQDGYGEGYDVGRNDGYDLGYDAGVQVGRTQGMNEVEPESLTNTLVAVFQQPFNQLYRFFNFNILGLNVLGIVSGLFSALVVLKVFKKLYK